ncbi:MAG: methyl-accepting chemotaxis protein [Spirochaetaceae bacterium]|jgi:methyl-accepting chemotaxis protein|nr:methyl-accepting chemotaxis protein [Spirochaetaceae bacterium]
MPKYGIIITMSVFNTLFHKSASRRGKTNVPSDETGSGPSVDISGNDMTEMLKASEQLVFSVLSGIQISSNIISKTHIQDENLDNFSSLLEGASDAVTEIYDVMDQMNRLVDTQSDTVSGSASAIEQMSRSIESVTGIVNESLGVTTNLSSSANDGNEKVKRVLNVVEVLNRNVTAIKTVVASINAISAQTNLLAMNASIEAAHAGEIGKGFSVVADEIRKLSEVTRTNALHIAGTLKSMIETLNEVRNAADVAGSAMRWIEERVEETTESFHIITENMHELAAGSNAMVKTAQMLASSSIDLRNRSSAVTSRLKTVSENVRHINTLGTDIQGASSGISSGAADTISSFRTIITAAGALQSVLDRAVAASDTFISPDPFPFTTIVLKHLMWVVRVRAILDGKMSGAGVETGNHHTCDLGKWLDSQREMSAAENSVFVKLDSEHEKMHKLVGDIFTNRISLSAENLEGEYEKLLTLSSNVISLLTELRSSL